MENKTHWKTILQSDYLASCDVQDKDLILTIKECIKKTVRTEKTEEQCVLAMFKEKYKPMILNRTNCKTLQKLYNSSFLEDWQNKQVQIYVDKNVRVGREIVEGLRIRPLVPQKAQKEELTENHTKWQSVCQSIREGRRSIDTIKNYFILSDGIVELLTTMELKNASK